MEEVKAQRYFLARLSETWIVGDSDLFVVNLELPVVVLGSLLGHEAKGYIHSKISQRKDSRKKQILPILKAILHDF